MDVVGVGESGCVAHVGFHALWGVASYIHMHTRSQLGL